MPNTKPFLSHEQQLEKLTNDKNLIIPDLMYAEEMLKQYGYFTLISGYKELFKNPTIKKYKDGTTFNEIVALYRFDESLRELFLKYIFTIELKMKSLLSYYFTEKYGENQQEYLSATNYTSENIKQRGIRKLTSTLHYIANVSNEHTYIRYQRRKYNNVSSLRNDYRI